MAGAMAQADKLPRIRDEEKESKVGPAQNSPLMTAAKPARLADCLSYLPNVPKLSSLV